MIKAFLVFWYVVNSTGEVAYANVLPMTDCKAISVELVTTEFKAKTRSGDRFEYLCVEPGATPIKAHE